MEFTAIFKDLKKKLKIYYRASYILNRDDVMNSAHFLMNISFNENQKNFGPGIRYRALQVLHTIMNTDSLEELTHRDIKSIRLL